MEWLIQYWINKRNHNSAIFAKTAQLMGLFETGKFFFHLFN